MDVVYIFHESDVTRVPLFHYDRHIFNLLAVRGGGVWDRGRREFIFNGAVSADRFGFIVSSVPYVWVEEGSSLLPRVFGFIGDACQVQEKAVSSLAFPLEVSVPSPELPLVSDPFLPEKFPEHWQNKLELELRSRKYSPRTRCAYLYFNRMLCRSLQKSPEEVCAEDIKGFLASIEKDKNYSASSMNLTISAIKFFYKIVLKKDISKEQRRPRQDRRLPVVLSKDEIKSILTSVKNLKHRLLLMMVYASGLRVSEVVCLKREDIDVDRKTISIISGKGRKDRLSIMSSAVIETIKLYYSRCNVSTWVFPGAAPGSHLSIRSAQHIFEKAINTAKIEKPASIHSLRHTFATHLLENGTDISYIKELLGHSSVKTTERYTHVARRKVLTIISPLDTIDNEG